MPQGPPVAGWAPAIAEGRGRRQDRTQHDADLNAEAAVRSAVAVAEKSATAISCTGLQVAGDAAGAMAPAGADPSPTAAMGWHVAQGQHRGFPLQV